MAIYEAGVLTVATAATADNAAATLWLPASVGRIRLKRIELTSTSATASKVALKRITARGTQGSTQAGAALDTGEAASNGTVDINHSVQPTVTGNYFRRAHIAASIGVGMVWSWESEDVGLVIGAGNGLALVTPTALILQPMELTYVWEE